MEGLTCTYLIIIRSGGTYQGVCNRATHVGMIEHSKGHIIYISAGGVDHGLIQIPVPQAQLSLNHHNQFFSGLMIQTGY